MIERHVLITIGDDPSALHGVRFVGSFFKMREGLRVVLFYVGQKVDCKSGAISAPGAKTEAIEAARSLLVDRGFPADRIGVKRVEKRRSTVHEIVNEAKAGLYDAVVLGRRGYSMFEQTLSNSVSREIIDKNIDFPVWVCRRAEEGRKNVLLCVDDTEPSIRIADHVGFMIEHETEHSVTVLHVDDGSIRNTDTLIEQVSRTLEKNGISSERFTHQVVRASNVAKAIMERAERGGFAVVAMGRGGKEPKGFLQKWTMGSKSLKIVQDMAKGAIWLSR